LRKDVATVELEKEIIWRRCVGGKRRYDYGRVIKIPSSSTKLPTLIEYAW